VADQPTSPFDRAVQVLLYAPVGLALTARDGLPQLVDKGRQHVESQVMLARFVGRLAIKRGTTEAERLVEQAVTLLGVLGGAGVTSPPPARPTGAPDAPRGSHAASSNGNGRGDEPMPAAAGEVPTEAELAIPGYDSLSAPQVVQRLGGLAEAELRAVRRYEEEHRGRRTILSKIAQLQSDTA
jgi:hypothetical protein